MEVLFLVIVFGAWAGTWSFVASRMRKMGKGVIARHLSGGLLGFLSFFVAAGVLSTFDTDERTKQETTDASDVRASAIDDIANSDSAGTDDQELSPDQPESSPVADESLGSNAPAQVAEDVLPDSDPVASLRALSDRRDQAQEESDIGVDVGTFTDRFNSAMATIGLPFRARGEISELESHHVQRGVNESFNDHLALVATVKPYSEDIRDITFIGSGDGTPESGANVIFTAASVFSSTQESWSVTDALNMVSGMVDEVTSGGENASRILNGLRYSYSQGEIFGNMFSVSSAN